MEQSARETTLNLTAGTASTTTTTITTTTADTEVELSANANPPATDAVPLSGNAEDQTENHNTAAVVLSEDDENVDAEIDEYDTSSTIAVAESDDVAR